MTVSFNQLRIALLDDQPTGEIVQLIEQLGGQLITAPTIDAIIAGDADILAFTNAKQIKNLLKTAKKDNIEPALRDVLKRTVIGSLDSACTKALRDAGLGIDFEPDQTQPEDLIRGLARMGGMLLRRKRASHAAGVDTSTYKRVDVVWPTDECAGKPDPLANSAFMKACRGEPTEHTPIWLMRQAGRYQREYRELRQKVSFLEMCGRPELAAEVTLMAVDQLGVDAAIIFADILLILDPMGVGLAFNKGEGPSIARPVRTGKDVDALLPVNPTESLDYVFEAVRMTRRALKPDVPLIGFCGAPFTVASYLIEGGSSRNFIEVKTFMYRDEGAWNALMARLTEALVGYLKGQIEAGAQVVQLFDSWVGCLNEADYRKYVLPHTKALVEAVKPDVPVIYFGTDTATLLKAMREAGSNVMGVDWRINLDEAWASMGYDVAVQGNLDPVTLFASPAEIKRQAKVVLDQAAGRPGHIFNLGHGILPNTPVDNALALIDFVHEYRHA